MLDSLIRSGAARRGIVVSGEQCSLVGQTATREMRAIRDLQFASLTVGDAGVAVLLEPGQPGPGHVYRQRTAESPGSVEIWPHYVGDMLNRSGREFAAEQYGSGIARAEQAIQMGCEEEPIDSYPRGLEPAP